MSVLEDISEQFVFLVFYILQPINYLFTEYLFLANIVSAAVLIALGDFLVQIVETRIHRQRRPHYGYNHTRTRHVLVVGGAMGVFNHLWYMNLEFLVAGYTLASVLKKIALDQAVAGPFFSSAFIVGMGIMEWRHFGDICSEWKSKFFEIYKVDWMFWPAAQFINFYMVPRTFHVLYVNVATLIWNIFLTYTRHKVE